MLVLTRRDGESLFITKDIQVRVLGVKGNQVRIGVDAPKGFAIYREEVRAMFEDNDAQGTGGDVPLDASSEALVA